MADGDEGRRRYRFQTALPETMVEDLRAGGLRLVGVSIGLGDAYGLFAVEFQAYERCVALDAAEETWRLTADGRREREVSDVPVVDVR